MEDRLHEERAGLDPYEHEVPNFYPTLAEIRAQLTGRDLCCWCPLGRPCHADVLLEIANGGAHD
jgi:hypothetical protein